MVVDFIFLALACYRITRFLISDFLIQTLRDKFWDRFPPESTKLGYLATCPWCLSIWVGLALQTCYTIVPLQTMWFCYVLALSAVVGLLTALEDKI